MYAFIWNIYMLTCIFWGEMNIDVTAMINQTMRILLKHKSIMAFMNKKWWIISYSIDLIDKCLIEEVLIYQNLCLWEKSCVIIE